MSDRPTKPPSSAARLINPTVRNYMEVLNLQRFYGGYVISAVPESLLNLGIGEVGNMPQLDELFAAYQRYISTTELATLAQQYSGTMGEQETNRLVADAMNRWVGANRFGEDGVVSLDGGQNAVDVAVRVFTSPLGSPEGRKQFVLMAAPCYPYFSAIISAHAGMQAFLAYDGEEFARGVETYCNPAVGLILINIPHNPMGYGLTAEQVRRIDRVAATYDCAILVDSVYASYADDPEVGRALAGFDPERTVFSESFSKQFGFPGLRLGFAVSASEPLAYAMRFVKMSESLTPSNVKLAFAGHLLANYGDYPAKIAAEVRGRRQRFLAAFQPPEEAKVGVFDGRPNPFYLTLDVAHAVERSGLSDTEIAQYCQKTHNVRVFPGGFVYPSPSLPHAMFSGARRLNPSGDPPYLAPSFPEGAQIVYAPDFFKGRTPLLRLSFGMETRVEAAAAALSAALSRLAEGGAG